MGEHGEDQISPGQGEHENDDDTMVAPVMSELLDESAAAADVEDVDLYDLIVDPLARGEAYAVAGARIGRSERSVRRRMSEPEFAAEVNERRREMLSMATGQFNAALDDAVATIVDCMHAENDGVRLRAAREVLDLGSRLTDRVELDDLVRRLDAQRRGGENRGVR